MDERRHLYEDIFHHSFVGYVYLNTYIFDARIKYRVEEIQMGGGVMVVYTEAMKNQFTSSIYRKLVENWKLCSDMQCILPASLKYTNYYYEHFSITFNEIPEHMAKNSNIPIDIYVSIYIWVCVWVLSAIYLCRTFSMFAFRTLL